jgi:hypothetical protein
MNPMKEAFEEWAKEQWPLINLDKAPLDWGNGPNAYMWEDTSQLWSAWQRGAEWQKRTTESNS